MSDARADRVAVVLVTGPTPESLESIARTLIEERLIACANILPTVRSIYRWEGAVEETPEALAIFKTTGGRVDALERRIAELHPYDVPEILAVDVAGGSEAYLAWVRGCVAPPAG